MKGASGSGNSLGKGVAERGDVLLLSSPLCASLPGRASGCLWEPPKVVWGCPQPTGPPEAPSVEPWTKRHTHLEGPRLLPGWLGGAVLGQHQELHQECRGSRQQLVRPLLHVHPGSPNLEQQEGEDKTIPVHACGRI